MPSAASESGAITIEDVARRASVSVATVSRALRGLPNVAPATRERVRAVALVMGYRPDPNASRLGARRTRTIGLGVPLLGVWYFSQVMAGAEAVLAADGYDVLLLSIGSVEARHRMTAGDGPLHRRVDGLLLVDLRLETDELSAFATTGAAIVTTGDSYPGLSSVAIDDRAAADIDEHAVGSKRGQDFAIDKPVGVRTAWSRNDERIDVVRHGHNVRKVGVGNVRLPGAAAIGNCDTESFKPSCNRLADAAEAENADATPLQRARQRERPVNPTAKTDETISLRNATDGGEQQAHSEIGDFIAEHTWRMRDRNTAPGRLQRVDMIIPNSEAGDHFQLR